MGEEGRKILQELGEGNSNQNTLYKKGTFNKRKIEKKNKVKYYKDCFKEETCSYRVKQSDWSWGCSVKHVRHWRHMLHVLPHTCGHFKKSFGRYSSDFLTVNKAGGGGREQLKFESSNVLR